MIQRYDNTIYGYLEISSEGEYIKFEDYKKERDEMLEALIEIFKKIEDNFSFIIEVVEIKELIEKVTGLSIDKALEEYGGL